MLAQVAGDLAEALHRHGLAAQSAVTPHLLGAGFHPHVQAQAGHYGGVAAAAQGQGQAGDVPGFLPHVLEVAASGADVGGGQVASSQGVHESPVGAHQGLRFVAVGVADDDALAAAQVQAGCGRLVGHGLGQAQGVGQGLGLALVGPHPGAAAGRAEGGVVDGDDGLEAGAGVGEHRHLLVAFGAHSL